MIIILTKNDCPMCNKLKLYMEHALTNEQLSNIQIVKQEENEDLFKQLVLKHIILTVPTAILNDNVYHSVTPAILNKLLKKINA